MLRVPCTTLHFAGMTASIEGKKMGCVSAKTSGHVNFIRISGEMHERPCLELKQRRSRVSVCLVLPHCVPPVLASAGILQLDSRHGQTVYGEVQIDRVVLA